MDHIIPDTSTQLAAARAGQMDYYQVQNYSDIDALKQTNPEIQYVEWERLYTPFICWKVDQPSFNDTRVRQAQVLYVRSRHGQSLLSAAGYPEGLKVEMISAPGYGQTFVQMGELVQQDLKAVGIEADVRMQEHGSHALGVPRCVQRMDTRARRPPGHPGRPQ